MRRTALTRVYCSIGVLVSVIGCRGSAPPPVPPPVPLSSAAADALHWVDDHTVPIAVLDSTRAFVDSQALAGMVSGASVVGVSEMTEGTAQFAVAMDRLLRQLVTQQGVRAIAIQAPMTPAIDIDRYVRGAPGVGGADPKRLLHALGAAHWETQGVLDLVEWMRTYNAGRPSDLQVGFAGFELPDLTRAVQSVTSLPETITGAALGAWLKRSYQCVRDGAAANWGREGRAIDSTYWTPCRAVSAAVTDSLVALRGRTSNAADVRTLDNAVQFARLVQHGVRVGLERLPRAQIVAEHVEWVLGNLNAGDKLLVWGRDVEAGRLRLDSNTVQMAVPLSEHLGDRYRALAFAVGTGAIRASGIPTTGRGGGPGREGNIDLARPAPGSFEDVFRRAAASDFLLDLRRLPSDSAGTWLAGPRSLRLINGVYSPFLLQPFQTQIQFPKNFDGVIFVRVVSPVTGYR